MNRVRCFDEQIVTDNSTYVTVSAMVRFHFSPLISLSMIKKLKNCYKFIEHDEKEGTYIFFTMSGTSKCNKDTFNLEFGTRLARDRMVKGARNTVYAMLRKLAYELDSIANVLEDNALEVRRKTIEKLY